MILNLMEQYFGRMGQLYLIREMKKLGLNSLKFLTDKEKEQLADALANNVFDPIMSRQKEEVIYHQILHELKLSDKRKEQKSNSLKDLYDITDNIS
jgi:uncharacterized membrane protein